MAQGEPRIVPKGLTKENVSFILTMREERTYMRTYFCSDLLGAVRKLCQRPKGGGGCKMRTMAGKGVVGG